MTTAPTKITTPTDEDYARDDHHDRSRECSFDGHDTTRGTHDTYRRSNYIELEREPRRDEEQYYAELEKEARQENFELQQQMYGGYSSYPRSNYDDHSGGYDSCGDSYGGDYGDSYGGDYGDSYSNDYDCSYGDPYSGSYNGDYY